MRDTLLVYNRFEVQLDGDALTLVCLACGATLHFAQNYYLPYVEAAAEDHALTECGHKEE